MKQKTISIVVMLLIVGGLFYWFSDFRDTGNTPDKSDLIRIEHPQAGQTVTSPITISGEARGPWFFEADFPVVIVDVERTMIGETIAMAKGDWMTEDFVPFEATLYFEQAAVTKSDKGTLIFYKHNASGLPEHNDSFELAVKLSDKGSPGPTIEQEISLPYEDESIGIQFEYRVSPKGYILEEPPIGNNEDRDLIKAIMLTRIADYEELQNSEGGREGPPTLNIYVFNVADSGLEQWLQDKSDFTNFSGNAAESFVMGGVEGLYFMWDGLYQGETVAIQRDGSVYMVVGTYLSGVEDGRRIDFQDLVNSFGFLN